ncbi:MAG: hypothetical protein CMP51_03585 [Flavobacteriales bacterium]|nr:hypothetical protein [Flavobacteriales bacterium]
MKYLYILLYLIYSFNLYSQQNINARMFIFDYTYQIPLGEISEKYGQNSSLSASFITNKKKYLYSIEASFMFGENIKNDSLLRNISTENGSLINSSGELDQILLSQRGFNTHLMCGKALKFNKTTNHSIFIYGGPGFMSHKINLQSNRTNLPQVQEDYAKGYDQLESGLSTKICIDYIYFHPNNFIKINMGINIINAFTKYQRLYNFSEMMSYEDKFKHNLFLGIKFGIIIPINSANTEKFYYR